MWTKKPAWSWLDRLRYSKGIPVTDDLNLEQFLTQNPNSESNSNSNSIQVQSNANSNPIQIQDSPPKKKSEKEEEEEEEDEEEEDQWFGTMSSVLSELFVMEEEEDDEEDSQKFVQKKSSRKQQNPKICHLSASTSDEGGGGAGVTAMSDNSVVEVEEKLELSGFSRSDLMIIDSSSVVWKTEKRVIRRGDVWKVKEKTPNSKSLCVVKKKKRRFKEFDEESDGEKKMEKKRKKMMMMKQKQKQKQKQKHKLSLPGDHYEVLPFQGSENDNQLAKKRTQPDLDKSPIKRCKFLRSPEKQLKKSSGFHMQTASTGRKNVVSLT